MFLRFNRRFKDGKEHRYWNIVESKRCASGKVVQRQVLYLGEINDTQREAWCRLIEAFDEDSGRHQQLAVTPRGFPLAYEILPGNTSDKTTLRDALRKIETQYGKARRIWVMDRGIPTEAVLAEMRAADPPIFYLVGTPKGRLSKLEKALIGLPWQAVRQGIEVKLLAQEQELYVLAQSHARIDKERAMRRRQLKWLWGGLKQVAAME